MGADTAATLLITAGDNPERMTSEASFAALCGTSPLQTSSGRIVRHRVNQGGNRQSNNALWRIATGRMVRDQRTIEYVERRRTEDKTRREVIRCPKRYTAREIYRLLRNPPQTPHGAELRCLRQKHRIIPRSGHHSPPQPHNPSLTTRKKPPTQPPPRHPIPPLAHHPHPTRIRFDIIGASNHRSI